MRKLTIAVGIVFFAYCLMKVSWWSSKCREPVLIEILHPQLPKPPEGAFTLVTLNMAGRSDPEKILREFENLKFLAEADIVFLQEVVHSQEGPAVLGALVDRLRLHAVFATASEPNLDGPLEGIAILSRRPLRDPKTFELHRFGLHFRSRCRLALGVTVETPFGRPMRVFGVHLDTRINATERIAQLGPVLDAAQSFDGPVVIGGDFNTNDVYWVQHILPLPYLHNQSHRLQAFLAQHGFSTPINDGRPTFNYFGFRLDWIYLRSLEASGSGVEPIGFSDHRAVWLQLADSRSPTER